MPIGVRGMYELTFNIAGKVDIIQENMFKSFAIVESAGGSLPEFELVFSSHDGTLVSRLNESAVCSVIMADGSNNRRTVNLFVVSPMVNRLGQNEYVYRLNGTINTPGYNVNQRIQLTKPISATEAIKAAAERYFKVEMECASSDYMTWIQHNTSDRRFINDCWLHTDLPNSFPLLAITMDGRFRFRDARKVAKSDPAAEFGYNAGYIINPEYSIKNGGSFLNTQGGYGIEQVELDLGNHQTFSQIKITQPVSSLLTNSPTLNRLKNSPTCRLAPVTLNENVHPNYWEAYRRNVASLNAYGTTEVHLSVQNLLVPVSAGDLALFKDDESNTRAIESYSGLYFVSKVGYTFERRGVVTGVVLNRENANAAQGDLR